MYLYLDFSSVMVLRVKYIIFLFLLNGKVG